MRKNKCKDPWIEAQVKAQEEDDKKADDQRDRAVIGDGVIDPVQGSKEIKDARKNTTYECLSWFFVPERDEEGYKGYPG
jgi:hypothetical protein